MNARPESRIEALRTPPHSVDAEQAVLGGLMLSDKALAQIDDWLRPEDFYQLRHKAIYVAIRDLAAKGKPYDAVTLGEWFEADGSAELVGGSSYVIKLANSSTGASNIAAYAEIVREKARLRELIYVGTSIAGQAFAPKADASLIASTATNTISQLVGDVRAGGLQPVKAGVSAWWESIQGRYARGEKMSGLPTPWTALNDITLGLQPGDLTVVAAQTSMGKSIVGFETALHNSLAGKNVAVFSLEMRADQLIQRGVASRGKIPHKSLRNPQWLTEDEWASAGQAMTHIRGAALHIDDQSGLTAPQIIARAKRQHLRSPLSLVVIDHLHEVRRPGRDPVNELSDVARAFKGMAKDLHIPVLLLAQLNRGASSRTDHRPTKSDLRGSGSIEEIADVILLIHREEVHNKSTHLKGVVEIIIEKGRDLPAGESIYLHNRYDQMRLEDWEGALPTKPDKAEKKEKGNGRGMPEAVADQRMVE